MPRGRDLVGAEEAVGVVFDDRRLFWRRAPIAVHFAGDAGVVDGDDGLGFGGDEGFELGFVEVEGVGADVDEDGFSAAEDEGVGGGDEGEGGDDDFVAGLDVQEEGGHFEGVGAASG